MEFNEYLDTNFNVAEVSGGREIKVGGACPFCGEDRSDLRLYVSPDTGLGTCFHCGESFGSIKFVMANESCNFKKAKKILSEDDNEFIVVKEKDERVESGVAWPVLSYISACEPAVSYLSDRNIGADIQEHFKLYYSADNTLIEGCTFNTSTRIIAPIHNIKGEAISWVGRTIANANPKYLFPPGFRGSEILYNAWSLPANPDYLIIGEGVMDVYGWWRAGAKNVVATFGKKISEPQVELLKQINPKAVFIAWDSDANWQKYEFAEHYGHLFDIRIVDMKGKDADECSGQELAITLRAAKSYCWEDKILAAL